MSNILYDSTLPVYTFWDIGINDSMSIWFAQFKGDEIRLVDYYENNGEALTHYIKHVKSLNYIYESHFSPWDASRREVVSGLTVLEGARNLGFEFIKIPRTQNVSDDIEIIRSMFNRFYFDEDKCFRGIACLEGYHREYDSNRMSYKDKPVHDWASHGADAFRTLARAVRLNMVRQISGLKWQYGERLQEYAISEYDYLG